MLKTTKRKIYRAIILVIILFCITGVSYSFISYYPIIQSKRFVEKYGWEVLNGGKDNTIILTIEFLNSEITNMQIDASKKIGLDPLKKYEDKSVVKYDYTLNQVGINNQLRAQLWMYKNKIICAYILHAETNIIIKYWSLDTPYQTIRSELNEIKME
jgi:hypothetical protein